jgi:signal transduction histidine kinase
MSRRNWIVDALVAAVFVVAGQLSAWGVIQDSNVPLHGSHLAQGALYLVIDSLVVLRRRAPLPALLVMLPFGVLQTALGGTSSFFAGFIPVALVLFGVGSRCSLRVTLAAAVYAFAGLVGIINRSEDLHYGAELPFAAVVIGVACTLGQVVRSRSQQTRSAIARADRLEVERDRVLEEERARIARELHDVIAHSVSVMIVQAGAARLSIEADPDRSVDAMRAVERSGRQALDEMRRLLGILRQGSAAPDLAPQPGLQDLDALVEQIGAAGLTVDVEITGTPVALAPGVDLSAYRIVQEALTNAIKHAGPARARLRLRYDHDAIAIEVVDDGRGVSGGNGRGHGLIGMRERAELYRGSFEAGDAPGGGFRVSARLPVGAA